MVKKLYTVRSPLRNDILILGDANKLKIINENKIPQLSPLILEAFEESENEIQIPVLVEWKSESSGNMNFNKFRHEIEQYIEDNIEKRLQQIVQKNFNNQTQQQKDLISGIVEGFELCNCDKKGKFTAAKICEYALKSIQPTKLNHKLIPLEPERILGIHPELLNRLIIDLINLFYDKLLDVDADIDSKFLAICIIQQLEEMGALKEIIDILIIDFNNIFKIRYEADLKKWIGKYMKIIQNNLLNRIQTKNQKDLTQLYNIVIDHMYKLNSLSNYLNYDKIKDLVQQQNNFYKLFRSVCIARVNSSGKNEDAIVDDIINWFNEPGIILQDKLATAKGGDILE